LNLLFYPGYFLAREYSAGTKLGIEHYKTYALHTYHSMYNRYDHIISIGDSVYERNAVIQLKNEKSHLKIKSIKFVESPTIDQLMIQQQYLLSCIEAIYGHPYDIDTMMIIQNTGGGGEGGG
jgi:hypothetical protein